MKQSFLEKYKIEPLYIPRHSKRRPGTLLQRVRFIVAHDTGNPESTARANVNYYINSRNEIHASAHIFTDDKEIIECIPALTAKAEKAWHVMYDKTEDNRIYGDDANNAAIGVEYCYGKNINSKEAYQRYVWVLAKLCHAYNLNPSRDIIGHHLLDPERRTDPVTGLQRSNRSYKQLSIDVVHEYKSCLVEEPATIKVCHETWKAKVRARLHMREAPSTKSTTKGLLEPGAIISFTSIIANGESIHNNPVWYRLTNGHYAWSGGLFLENEKSINN